MDVFEYVGLTGGLIMITAAVLMWRSSGRKVALFCAGLILVGADAILDAPP